MKRFPGALVAPFAALLAAGVLASGNAVAACLAAPAASAVAVPAASYLASYRVDFKSPTRLAIDTNDRLYVADPAAGDVLVRNADGSVRSWQRGLGTPVSIAVDGSSRIYVGDGAAGRVRVYDSAWTTLFDLGAGAGEFAYPGDMTIDPVSGRIYVSDTRNHTIKVFNADGSGAFSFGGPGSADGQFQTPTGIYYDAARSELWVMDQLNYRLQAFQADGTYKFCIGQYTSTAFPPPSGGPSRTFGFGQGLWVDALGRIYVADAFQGQVAVFDRDGFPLRTIAELGSAPGQLRVPTDLALDSLGRLFVASANNARIEIYGIDTFSNPEAVVPAQLNVIPSANLTLAAGASVELRLTVPGQSPATVDAGSLRVNGLTPLAVTIGDPDGDGTPDVVLRFDAATLAATIVPANAGPLVAVGQVGGMALAATTTASLTISVLADADGDGVADADDICPGTPIGAVAGSDGCSVAQSCPCAGPAPAVPWRDHAEFHDCRQGMIADLIARGRYNLMIGTLFIEGARSSHCGRP